MFRVRSLQLFAFSFILFVLTAASSFAQVFSSTATNQGKLNGKIAFSSDRYGNNTLTIWTMNADGSNPTQLTTKPSSSSYVYDQRPTWSPDGSKIAFRSLGRGSYPDNSIYIMDADGSNLRQVIIDSAAISGQIGGFGWSPDGTKFLLSTGVYGACIDVCPKFTTNLFTASVDGKNVVRLTNDKEVVNGSATWSPDEKLILFVSNSQDGSGNKIQVMNADGSNRRTIAIGGSSPSWSPNSSEVIFVSPGAPYSCYNVSCDQLSVVSTDGSHPKQLTHYAGSYIGPRYSSDGTKILFDRHSQTYYETHDFPFGARFFGDDGYAVFIMDADGSNQTIISNRASDYDPDWQTLSQASNEPAPSSLGFSSDIYTTNGSTSPKVQVVVRRSGNLNLTVSCDYRIDGFQLVEASGTLAFAPGETSKVIDFAPHQAIGIYQAHLSNNAGNATLVGGIKHAVIVFLNGTFNPLDNTDFFVRQQYEDFLNRSPDEAGWRFWNITLYICGTGAGAACYQSRRPDVSGAFFLSTEFQETGYLVYRTYKSAFGNLLSAPVPIRFEEFLPDTRQIGQGVIVNEGNWQQQLETNKQKFFVDFVQRSRFASAFPGFMTPVQFVDALFANTGVTPSALERESAIGEFNGATGSADNAARARALRRIAENPALAQQEFNRAFVLMEYFGYLRRNPNEGQDRDYTGYDFWLTKLNQFNGDYQKSEMVKAFITSSEYRKRFGP